SLLVIESFPAHLVSCTAVISCLAAFSALVSDLNVPGRNKDLTFQVANFKSLSFFRCLGRCRLFCPIRGCVVEFITDAFLYGEVANLTHNLLLFPGSSYAN